jgi:transcriptional regulator
MNKTLTTGIVLAGTITLAAYAGNEVLSMPDAFFSYATNECVKVISYTDEVFACENLPAKFNHVWVK